MLLLIVGAVALTIMRMVGEDGTGDQQRVARTADAPQLDERPVQRQSDQTEPAQGVRREEATDEPMRDRSRERKQQKRDMRDQRRVVTTQLAAPTGDCPPSDVVVAPDVVDAPAYRTVELRLGLSTQSTRACRLALTAESLVVEVTSGDDRIWRLDACPTALPDRELVLRSGWLTYVDVVWSGRRASGECSTAEPFADPGYYWVESAVLGGEPNRAQFELEEPPPSPPKEPKQNGQGLVRSREAG